MFALDVGVGAAGTTSGPMIPSSMIHSKPLTVTVAVAPSVGKPPAGQSV